MTHSFVVGNDDKAVFSALEFLSQETPDFFGLRAKEELAAGKRRQPTRLWLVAVAFHLCFGDARMVSVFRGFLQFTESLARLGKVSIVDSCVVHDRRDTVRHGSLLIHLNLHVRAKKPLFCSTFLVPRKCRYFRQICSFEQNMS
jgi:hypothetical protein